VTVAVVMIVIVRTIVVVVTAALTMTVVRALTVVVAVAGDVAVVVDVFAMRAADAVHDVQHARKNALRHINKYQGRALAN
jgi:hypothetical protein